MNEFDVPTEDQRDEMRRRFVEAQLVNELLTLDSAEESAPPRIPVSRLYTIARTMGADMPADVATELLRQPKLRAVYRRLLAGAASYNVPIAMAASTDTLPVREGQGCRIRFEESMAEPDQLYVIVELTDEARSQPTALVFCDAEDHCTRFELPDWRNGIAQWIVERNSDIVRLARDPNSVAYFR